MRLTSNNTIQTLNSQAVIVLGMHRSGTSAFMRVLNLLGVEIGKSLIPENSFNERGFWELTSIVQANERVLQLLHSAWNNPLPFDQKRLHAPEFVLLRHHFAGIIRQHFSNAPLWGMKDPRLCRLLPIWLPILQKAAAQLNFVIVIRHPEEVAASLKRRDNLSHPISLWLWLTYLLEAEQYTRPYSRVFVTYNELLTDWQATVERIATALKLTGLRKPTTVQADVDAFLSPDLKHHHADNTLDEDILSQWSITVYQAMVKATQSCDILLERKFDNIRRDLCCYAQSDGWVCAVNANYQRWLSKNVFPQHKIRSKNSELQPTVEITFHIIVYLPQAPDPRLEKTLNALAAQNYPHWLLTVIASIPPEIASAAALMSLSTKMQWLTVPSVHLAQALKTIVESHPSTWVALLTVGDSFESTLLSTCVDYLQHHSQWRLFYVDEDTFSTTGEYYAPRFKPDVNPDLLRTTPYIGHFALVEWQALQAVGGYEASEGWENYDIALKILDLYGERALGHIPQVLYHQRATIVATSPTVETILHRYLERNALAAEIYETDFSDIYHIEYALQQNSFVSIIIATRNDHATLRRCLQSLQTVTTYLNYEILVVDNCSTNLEMLNYLAEIQEKPRIRVLSHSQVTTLPVLNNFGAMLAHGDYLLFLNDDTEIIQPDWLQELLAHGQRPQIGAVGARLLDSHQRLRQAGFILGMGTVGIAGHIHQGLLHDEGGYLGRAQAVQNLSAIADACMLVSKSLYLTIGSMTETLTLFNDVDLCLRITKQGYKIVWTPFATLLQHGVGSCNRQRLLEEGQLEGELNWMYTHWLSQLCCDPAYNPNLSLHGKEWQADIEMQVSWNKFHNGHRIVAFPYDSWGCGEYRVRAPLRALHQAQKIEYALMPEDEARRMPTLSELKRMQPDTLLIHNTLHDDQLQALKYYYRFTQCFKVFSQDDLLYNLPETNPFAQTNYKDIQERIYRAITYCHRLLVTTEPLAIAYRSVATDIRIIPNYLERARWSSLSSQRGTSKKPRIGWAGATQHGGDLQIIATLVKTLAKKVEWIFFGMCPEELRPFMSEFHPMVAFDHYPAKLASLNLDIAIAPLEIHPFNEAKSNLRLLEYGILGLPVVCSDIFPYQNAPVLKVTNTTAAWLEGIHAYIDDLNIATAAGQYLKQWVLSQWMLENHLEEWMAALVE